MLTIFLIIVFATVLSYILFVRPMSYWKRRGVRQGTPLWLFGDNWGTFFQLQSLTEVAQYHYNQCPGTRYSGLYQFVTPTLLVKDPELIKEITIKDFSHFVDHRNFIPDTDPFWSKGVFTLKGQEWRSMRLTLTPSFSSAKLKYMFVIMTEHAENVIKYLLKKDEETITLDTKDVFSRFATDVIASTVFGVTIDSLAKPNNEVFSVGKNITDFSSFWRNFQQIFLHLMLPIFSHLFKPNFYTSESKSFFNKFINETLKIREEKGIERPDLINLFIEARKRIGKQEENDTGVTTKVEEGSHLGKEKAAVGTTNIDIAAQALIFFFAGVESVAILMCFIVHELALNPDVQETLRKEVNNTLKKCGGKLTYDGLMNMKYMHMVILETQRKWPNFTTTDRVCTKSFTINPTTPDEKVIHLEKGAKILFPIFGIHRDPKFYPNPDRFDPERFSEANKENIKPYTYLPFGLGPRSCIASRFSRLEAKVMIFHILQHFQLVPVAKTEIPLQITTKGLNITAKNGFWIGLKSIKI